MAEPPFRQKPTRFGGDYPTARRALGAAGRTAFRAGLVADASGAGIARVVDTTASGATISATAGAAPTTSIAAPAAGILTALLAADGSDAVVWTTASALRRTKITAKSLNRGVLGNANRADHGYVGQFLRGSTFTSLIREIDTGASTNHAGRIVFTREHAVSLSVTRGTTAGAAETTWTVAGDAPAAVGLMSSGHVSTLFFGVAGALEQDSGLEEDLKIERLYGVLSDASDFGLSGSVYRASLIGQFSEYVVFDLTFAALLSHITATFGDPERLPLVKAERLLGTPGDTPMHPGDAARAIAEAGVTYSGVSSGPPQSWDVPNDHTGSPALEARVEVEVPEGAALSGALPTFSQSLSSPLSYPVVEFVTDHSYAYTAEGEAATAFDLEVSANGTVSTPTPGVFITRRNAGLYTDDSHVLLDLVTADVLRPPSIVPHYVASPGSGITVPAGSATYGSTLLSAIEYADLSFLFVEDEDGDGNFHMEPNTALIESLEDTAHLLPGTEPAGAGIEANMVGALRVAMAVNTVVHSLPTAEKAAAGGVREYVTKAPLVPTAEPSLDISLTGPTLADVDTIDLGTLAFNGAADPRIGEPGEDIHNPSFLEDVAGFSRWESLGGVPGWESTDDVTFRTAVDHPIQLNYAQDTIGPVSGDTQLNQWIGADGLENAITVVPVTTDPNDQTPGQVFQGAVTVTATVVRNNDLHWTTQFEDVQTGSVPPTGPGELVDTRTYYAYTQPAAWAVYLDPSNAALNTPVKGDSLRVETTTTSYMDGNPTGSSSDATGELSDIYALMGEYDTTDVPAP